MEARIQRRIGLCDPGMSVIDTMSLAPLLDLDFTQGRHYAHRSVVSSALTFTRASSALDYSVQPAILRATNIPRYMQNSGVNGLNGVLIEGADANVIINNTIYAAGNWTAYGAMMMSDVATPDLYGGHSFSWQDVAPGAGVTSRLVQNPTLTAVKYVVSFLAKRGNDLVTGTGVGLPITATDLYPFAHTALGDANIIVAFNYEHVGGDVYLCWGVFTATATAWYIGVGGTSDGNNRLTYYTCLTCHIAAPTNEGGDFPRSPIPNTTGASITRAAESLTIAADGNIGLAQGTIDVEFIAPGTDAAVTANLAPIDIIKDGNNRMGLCYSAATDGFLFAHVVGGISVSANVVGLIPSRGSLIKIRGVYGPDISGAKDLICYASINSAAWAERSSANGPLGGSFPTGATIKIGYQYTTDLYHLGSLVRRFRCFNYAKLGLPGDF